MRLSLSQAFVRLGWEVRATSSAATLLKLVANGEGDAIIASMPLPSDDGLDLLARIRKQRPDLPVFVTSSQTTLLTAVTAATSGAYDYLPKPLDIDQLVDSIRRSLSRASDTEKARATARAMRDDQLPLIGRSKPMQEVYKTVARLVGVDLTVLVSGESGTCPRPRRTRLSANSSTARAASPAMRREEPCSWTRSGMPRQRCRPGCCGRWRSPRRREQAANRHFASLPRPATTSRRWWRRAGSARISISA